MDDNLKLLIGEVGDLRVKQNIDVSEYLITGLGTVVKAFYLATTTEELIKVVLLCRELKLPYMIIGSGSKVALSNTFPGILIKNRSDWKRIFGIKGKVSRNGLGVEEAMIEVASGLSLDGVYQYMRQQNLTGLESLQSIPGTIGGSLLINTTLRSKVQEVKVLTTDGEPETKDVGQVNTKDIILSVIFKLKSKSLS